LNDDRAAHPLVSVPQAFVVVSSRRREGATGGATLVQLTKVATGRSGADEVDLVSIVDGLPGNRPVRRNGHRGRREGSVRGRDSDGRWRGRGRRRGRRGCWRSRWRSCRRCSWRRSWRGSPPGECRWRAGSARRSAPRRLRHTHAATRRPTRPWLRVGTAVQMDSSQLFSLRGGRPVTSSPTATAGPKPHHSMTGSTI
jgi:hypothetical protein